jgi:NAD(P)H-quinone oxidoreductase subunit 5
VTFFGSYRGNVDPSDLGLRHPELAGTSSGLHPEEHEEHPVHAPAWLMSGPVAILMVPTVLIGWLNFGGENSPWARFFAPVFPKVELVGTAPPELMTSALVLALVVIGFAIAYVRYGSAAALGGAVERLRSETVRQPAILTNAFYFDAAIDALFVRPAIALGRFLGGVIEPRVIDAGVREASISASWLGHLFRSFQTGLVRAYALTLAFGVACFVLYYALAGGAK